MGKGRQNYLAGLRGPFNIGEKIKEERKSKRNNKFNKRRR